MLATEMATSINIVSLRFHNILCKFRTEITIYRVFDVGTNKIPSEIPGPNLTMN